MTHKISTYILLGLLAVFQLSVNYHGIPALLDSVATWRNNGYPASEARLAVELTNSVSARKIKK